METLYVVLWPQMGVLYGTAKCWGGILYNLGYGTAFRTRREAERAVRRSIAAGRDQGWTPDQYRIVRVRAEAKMREGS